MKSPFDHTELLSLLQGRAAITSLDIGARGEIKNDLDALAPFVNVVGFEPDEQVCLSLNARDWSATRWRSVRFISAALGRDHAEETLYSTYAGGTSSLYRPLPDAGQIYSRSDYYHLKEGVPLCVSPLDEVLAAHGVPTADHIKLDVEGYELEVLAGARNTLPQVTVLRIEVSFVPMRERQPLYYDLGAFLDEAGFAPFEFVELHHWRNSTKVKYPERSEGAIPFSKGQMIHGDLLFYRKAETLDFSSDHGVQRAVRYGLIALCYGHVDHCAMLFKRPEVLQWINDNGITRSILEGELSRVSKNLYKAYRRAKLKELARVLRGLATRAS